MFGARKTIIDVILANTQATVAARKAARPLPELKAMAKDAPPVRSLVAALRAHPFSVIAEVKAMSPSVGPMDADNVARAHRIYEQTQGVSAISVLTDEHFFGGSLDRLKAIRAETSKPVLRKDFIIDEYQVWEARAYSADAILLMPSLSTFDPKQGKNREKRRLFRLYELATALGMDCLCEIGMTSHNEDAVAIARRVPKDAPIWGVNSRQFKSDNGRFGVRARLTRYVRRWRNKDPWTDLNHHAELRKVIPEGSLAVAESGITQPQELRTLATLNYHAALIGTAFLKSGQQVAPTVNAFNAEVQRIRQGVPAPEAAQPVVAPALHVRHA